MENASKALIIAGAILISILLVGVGMMVFGNIGGITGQAGTQMDEIEIQMFNSKFTQYEGTKITGANVRALIQNVISSNAANTGVDGKEVSVIAGSNAGITGGATANGLSSDKAKINTGATYTVTLQYRPSGLVLSVTIAKN